MTQEALQDSDNNELEERLKSRSTWLRLLYIAIFSIFLGIAEFVLAAVVVFQFVTTLFTGKTNDPLKEFGASLARYCYDIIRFLTFNSDERPFPFSDWPEGDIDTATDD